MLGVALVLEDIVVAAVDVEEEVVVEEGDGYVLPIYSTSAAHGVGGIVFRKRRMSLSIACEGLEEGAGRGRREKEEEGRDFKEKG